MSRKAYHLTSTGTMGGMAAGELKGSHKKNSLSFTENIHPQMI